MQRQASSLEIVPLGWALHSAVSSSPRSKTSPDVGHLNQSRPSAQEGAMLMACGQGYYLPGVLWPIHFHPKPVHSLLCADFKTVM